MVKVWFYNFLKNRVDALLSNVEIGAIVADCAKAHVKERLAGYDVESIIGKVAYRKISDDCDVESLVSDRIADINISDHIDYSELASSIEYEELIGSIDYSEVASCIDYSDLAKEIDYHEVAARVDTGAIGDYLKDNLTIEIRVS